LPGRLHGALCPGNPSYCSNEEWIFATANCQAGEKSPFGNIGVRYDYHGGELTNAAPDANELINAKIAAPSFEVSVERIHRNELGVETRENDKKFYHTQGIPAPDLGFHGKN